MIVFTDYHHADLARSLAMLFEDRFGWTLYHPAGMEWMREGYWQFEAHDWYDNGVKVRDAEDVPRQYLEGVWANWLDRGSYREAVCMNQPGRTIKGLTVEQAHDLRPDVVIASVPQNEEGFYRFAKEVGAVYGVQIGNQWQTTRWDLAEFGLISTTLTYPHVPRPHVFYRQEFNLRDFRYERPPRSEPFRIRSFVQSLPDNPLAYAEFLEYREAAPDLDFGFHGHYAKTGPVPGALGNLPTTSAVAAAMRGSDAIWHTKEWSDGYGHVIHNAFAVGRPVVGRAAYYADKLASPLWVDGVTSIDIGSRSHDEVLAILRRFRDDEEYHLGFCEASAARFREVVNFDAEAEAIRRLFEQVLP